MYVCGTVKSGVCALCVRITKKKHEHAPRGGFVVDATHTLLACRVAWKALKKRKRLCKHICVFFICVCSPFCVGLEMHSVFCVDSPVFD